MKIKTQTNYFANKRRKSIKIFHIWTKSLLLNCLFIGINNFNLNDYDNLILDNNNKYYLKNELILINDILIGKIIISENDLDFPDSFIPKFNKYISEQNKNSNLKSKIRDMYEYTKIWKEQKDYENLIVKVDPKLEFEVKNGFIDE